MSLEHHPRIVDFWLLFQCYVQTDQPHSQAVQILQQTYQRKRCSSSCKGTGDPFLLLLHWDHLWACHILLLLREIIITSFIALHPWSSVSYTLFKVLNHLEITITHWVSFSLSQLRSSNGLLGFNLLLIYSNTHEKIDWLLFSMHSTNSTTNAALFCLGWVVLRVTAKNEIFGRALPKIRPIKNGP